MMQIGPFGEGRGYEEAEGPQIQWARQTKDSLVGLRHDTAGDWRHGVAFCKGAACRRPGVGVGEPAGWS